jgi:hypothetical protein
MPFRPKVAMGGLDLLDRTSPSTARLIKQQMTMLKLLQQRPVILVSPYVITLK